MKLPVVLLEEAQDDLDQISETYDETSDGLGDEFLTNVRSALMKIREFPKLYAVYELDVRRAAVQRFPYSVLYRVLEEEIEVVGIVHNRRGPSFWKGRM